MRLYVCMECASVRMYAFSKYAFEYVNRPCLQNTNKTLFCVRENARLLGVYTYTATIVFFLHIAFVSSNGHTYKHARTHTRIQRSVDTVTQSTLQHQYIRSDVRAFACEREL